jgi:ABC-type dipeptide/oligopeptide/nickel transport system permease component
VAIAVPAGIISAVKRGSAIDRLAMVGAVAGQAVPIFWLALLLIAFFGVRLRWFPVYGTGSLAHLVLPAVSLSTIILGRLARLVRSSMLEVLGQDYVRTARAKGLAEPRVLGAHALKNAAIPIVTLLGLQFAQLLGGAVVTETIFAWPGIGRLVVEAIFNADFSRRAGRRARGLADLRGGEHAGDLAYAALDPRIAPSPRDAARPASGARRPRSGSSCSPRSSPSAWRRSARTSRTSPSACTPPASTAATSSARTRWAATS